MENFKTQWHNEPEPEKEGSNRELPIPQLDPKNWKSLPTILFEIGVGAQTNSFIKDFKCQRQIMQIEERKAKPITHKA
jgi:hypothetical protein